MSTFAYSVAIKLSVANLASQGIRILAGDLLKAHGNAVALGDKLKALKMVAVGYGMDKAGSGILGFMGKSIDASKEYTRQLSLMNAAGMSQLEIARATASAWSTSQSVVTSSAADNLKAIRELRSVFGAGNMVEAYGILPTVQRTKGILDALTGKDQEGVAFDMVKAIELRTAGVMSAARMQQNADLMSRSLMAMGGTLNVNDFHMAMKQSRTAAFGLNDDFAYNYLPTLIQEVKTKTGGGGNAGTALMSLYQTVIGGNMKKSAIPMWEAMGLISPGDVVHNSTGAVQLKPGAVQGSAMFQANPYQWANQVLAPALATYGAAHGLNREQAISGLFGNRLSQWLVNTLIAKAPQFERDKQLIQSGGNSYQTYQKLLQSNPQLAEQAMHAQWSNILSILGYKVLPALIPWMIRFANGLNRIGSFMERHGRATSVFAFGLLGVGAALSLIGKSLMTVGLLRFLGMGPVLTSLFSGLTGGLGAIGAAIAGIGWPITLTVAALAGLAAAIYGVYSHWQGIKSFFGFGGGASAPNFVPPPRPQSSGHGTVYMDGKPVGKIVAPHVAAAMGKSASGPNTGTTGFDFSRAPARPAMAGG